jgi:hypothetical protein
MKQFKILKIAALLLLILIQGAAFGQVRVSEKPIPPRTRLQMSAKPGAEYVLLPGRWVWHRQTQMYVWLGPVWIVPPKGKTWSPGYWKAEKDGWKWVPGKWQRKRGILHRKNKSMTP